MFDSTYYYPLVCLLHVLRLSQLKTNAVRPALGALLYEKHELLESGLVSKGYSCPRRRKLVEKLHVARHPRYAFHITVS